MRGEIYLNLEREKSSFISSSFPFLQFCTVEVIRSENRLSRFNLDNYVSCNLNKPRVSGAIERFEHSNKAAGRSNNLRLLYSFSVFPGLGIDTNDVILIYEKRNLNNGAGFKCHRFGARL